MSGLRAEDVKEALEKYEAAAVGLWYFPQWVFGLAAAARLWLASQEQTPDYEAAAKALAYEASKDVTTWETTPDPFLNPWREKARIAVDAALGIHPQNEGDER